MFKLSPTGNALVFIFVLKLTVPSYTLAHDQLFSFQILDDGVTTSFGDGVIVTSDLNSDGVRDVLISQPNATVSGQILAGKVHVISGANAAQITTLSTGVVADQYGSFLGNLGDLDGDNYDEFAIFFNEDNGFQNVGEFEIFGSRLFNYMGGRTGFLEDDYFGNTVVGISDLNGNGFRDYLVYGGDTANDQGRVVAYDGSTDNLIYAVQGTQSGGLFGLRMRELGDIDQDGVSDFLVFAAVEEPVNQITGLPEATLNKAGRIHARSGKTGSSIYLIAPQIAEIQLGAYYAVIDDLNQDGISDFVAGCARCQDSIYPNGYLNVYSGASGDLITQLLPAVGDTFFCEDPVNLGDLTGDGRGDFACLSGPSAGEVRIIRGGTYRTIATIRPEAPNEYFYSIFSDDFNSDGRRDLILTRGVSPSRTVQILNLDIAPPQDFSVRTRVRSQGSFKVVTTFQDDWELCDRNIYAAPTMAALNRNRGTLIYSDQVSAEPTSVIRATGLPSLNTSDKRIFFRTVLNCASVTRVEKDKTVSFAGNQSRERVAKRALIRAIKRKLREG